MIRGIASPFFFFPWQVEIIAIVIGFAVGYIGSRFESDAYTALSILAALLLVAIVGGSTVASRPAFLNRPSRAFAVGGQWGLKAGFRATLSAGALWCFLATVRAFSAANAAEETLVKEKMWLTFWVALAALLPSLFCGFMGGAVAAWLIRSRIPVDGGTSLVPHVVG